MTTSIDRKIPLDLIKHLCFKKKETKKTELEENYYILEEDILHILIGSITDIGPEVRRRTSIRILLKFTGSFGHFKKTWKLESYKNINGENKTGRIF